MSRICPLMTAGAMGSKEGWEAILNSGKSGLDCILEECEYWITYDDIHRTDVTGKCVVHDIAILLFNMIDAKKR